MKPAAQDELPLRSPPGVLGTIVARTVADLHAGLGGLGLGDVGLSDAMGPTRARPSRPHYPGWSRSLRLAARSDPRGLALIAEVKPASPSRGALLERRQVPAYVQAVAPYAAALSVLVDGPFFGGGLDLLAEVRGMTDKPLLAKGFFVSVAQLDAALAAGADAALLMAAVLPPESLRVLWRAAGQRGLGVLVEAHDAMELREIRDMSALVTRDLKADSPELDWALGINARNLSTLHIDAAGSRQLLATLPVPGPVRVAESGLSSAVDLEALVGLADAVLVGSSLASAADPAAAAAALGFAPLPRPPQSGVGS